VATAVVSDLSLRVALGMGQLGTLRTLLTGVDGKRQCGDAEYQPLQTQSQGRHESDADAKRGTPAWGTSFPASTAIQSLSTDLDGLGTPGNCRHHRAQGT
jgi:hypothetical protein